MTIKAGDRVRHRGTRQWGRVLEVRPWGDGTAELLVEREPAFAGDLVGQGWWGSYHVGAHEEA